MKYKPESLKFRDAGRGALRAILVVVVAIITPATHASDTDGRWWRKLNENEKLTYVIGFFDGMSYATMILTKESLKAMADPKSGKFSAARAEPIKQASIATIQSLKEKQDNVTAGQAVDGLDTTYADYRNQGIPVTEALHIVLLSIKGGSDSEVARLLEMSRKNAGR